MVWLSDCTVGTFGIVVIENTYVQGLMWRSEFLKPSFMRDT